MALPFEVIGQVTRRRRQWTMPCSKVSSGSASIWRRLDVYVTSQAQSSEWDVVLQDVEESGWIE